MSWLRKAEWPWWQAGLMLGLLNAFAFYTANYYLSTSTTFSRAAGMIVGLVAPAHVAANAYYRMVKPVVDWQFMLVLGIPLGAYLAARLGRGSISFTTEMPALPGLLGVNHWVVIVPLVAVFGAALVWLDRRGS